MRPVKAVSFTYTPSKALSDLFETFGQMCNDAIRIAVDQGAYNRFDLISKSYDWLKQYSLHSHYIQNACEIAFVIYQKWRKSQPENVRAILTLPYFKRKGVLNELVRRRVKLPYVSQAFIKLDNQSYRLDYLLLRIPIQPRKFAFITLNGSLYHRSFLADMSLKRGSVTITGRAVVIAFSKEIAETEPRGQIGIDVNERNVTWSDTRGITEQMDTTEIAEIKARYREVRAKIAQRTQKDRRTQQELLSKYGKREKDRTVQRIHQKISKKIIDHARANQLGIVLEKLKGIRKLYRKGNGQGSSFRGRMNSWTFNEIQTQIEYKAAWEGIPVIYVNPRGTSRNCLCGSRVVNLGERRLYCPECDRTWDRDVLASMNIMAAPLVRAARSSRGSNDGGTR